ncbi:MAG: stage II sporulation protein P, partial [Geobacillus sp.]|nr:stage II sporulation protein P [Geobacillus sp.]
MKRWRSPNVVIAVPGASLKKLFMLIILGCMMMFMLVGALTSLRPEYRPSSSSLNDMAAHFPEEMFI